MSKGQNSFNPTIAFIALGSVAAFAPQHAKAQRTFRPVVGGLHTVFFQKNPKRIHLPRHPAGQLADIIIGVFNMRYAGHVPQAKGPLGVVVGSGTEAEPPSIEESGS